MDEHHFGPFQAGFTGRLCSGICNHELEYVKKCISSFPEKCYRFIKSQQYSEIDNQLIADDEVVKVLLEIYKKLKEYEDEESMNEIMDLFDEYIYRGNRMIMDALGKIG